MFVAVDQGNTQLKATFIRTSDMRVVEECHIPHTDLSLLHAAVSEYKPDAGCYCAVGVSDNEVVSMLETELGDSFLILNRETPLPIENGYKGVATLGLDRIAAACGAAMLSPGRNILIADAGTALTLDLLDSRGMFRGGNISPGLRLRFEVLNDATAALPLVDAAGATPLLGEDTLTAIRSGVVNGMVFEMAGMYEAVRRQEDSLMLMLTGGDAQLIARKIENENSLSKKINFSLQPNLVAFGLLSIYRHNEQ